MWVRYCTRIPCCYFYCTRYVRYCTRYVRYCTRKLDHCFSQSEFQTDLMLRAARYVVPHFSTRFFSKHKVLEVRYRMPWVFRVVERQFLTFIPPDLLTSGLCLSRLLDLCLPLLHTLEVVAQRHYHQYQFCASG